VCDECDIGITEQQAAQIMAEIDRTADRRGIDVAKFIERFQVVYVAEGGESLANTLGEDQAWAAELMGRVGRAIVGAAGSAVDIFNEFDASNSGYLDYSEFGEAVAQIDSGPDGVGTVSRAQLQELARLVDADGNGRINILEFCEAFVARDSGGGGTPRCAPGAPAARLLYCLLLPRKLFRASHCVRTVCTVPRPWRAFTVRLSKTAPLGLIRLGGRQRARRLRLLQHAPADLALGRAGHRRHDLQPPLDAAPGLAVLRR